MHADLGPFADLGLIFSVAVVIALVFSRLGLPPVLAYLGTGLLLGHSGLGLVEHGAGLEVFAEVGVVLLLFTVGLEFSLDQLRRAWRAVMLAGGLQVAATVAAALGIGRMIGIPWETAITWGFLVSLSSTAVVLRLLDARGESAAAHGRLVTGVLIFQDLCVVPMMLLLPILGGRGGGLLQVGFALAKSAAIVGAILVGTRLVVPRLMRLVARTRNREVFLLAVLAVGGLTAYATSLTGLSLALGAFLAGMILADTQYSHQALADVLPLRAVMMCVFFVTIGMLIDVATVRAEPALVIGLFTAILLGKFTLMTVAGLVLRFPVRIAALAGAALAQVGEFSFVLSTAAIGEGLITADQQRVFLAASVLTIAITPIGLSLFPRFLAGTRALAPIERLLDGGAAPPVVVESAPLEGHVIVAGLGVGGRTVISSLERVGIRPVIIELNPETVHTERARGRSVVYGDVTSAEVLGHASIATARALVLVVSDPSASRVAADVARGIRHDLPIVVRTRFAADEGAERRNRIDVLSEEFAGALATAGLVLRRCGVQNWSRVLSSLVAEHEKLPEEHEGDLGPPPPLKAAEALAFRTLPPNTQGLPAKERGTARATWWWGFAFGGALGAWVLSNVLFVQPVGELSFHREALGLLCLYFGAALAAGLLRPADARAG